MRIESFQSLHISLFCRIFAPVMTEKNQIIETTLRLFKKYGIKSVSMDDICHELGISKKTLYVHYAQKDDLVAAAMAALEQEIKDGVSRFEQEDREIWDMIQCWAEQLKKGPDVRKIPALVYDLNKYYPALAREHNKKIEAEHTRAMKSIIARGQEQGLFRPEIDLEMCAHFFCRIHSKAIEDSVSGEYEDFPLHRIHDFSMDILLRGILTEDGMRKYLMLRSKE